MDIAKHNEAAWNLLARQKDRWTVPVSEKDLENARKKIWSIVLTPKKPVPHEWFPDLNGLKILGLASGGGQQCPILAALGAEVTLFDNSGEQLARDIELSNQFSLGIRAIQGDMRDLSIFPDDSFDLVFNPCSLLFVDDIDRVWKECSRVLRKGGILMAGLINPMIFQTEETGGKLIIAYKQPYSDVDSLAEEKLEEKVAGKEPLEFGHSLTDQIGGQLRAGFAITDFYEDDWGGEEMIDQFLPGFFATRAIKK